MSEKKAVLIRVNIAGYSEQAATLFAAYDPATDMLLIGDVAKAYEAGPRDGFLKITNQSRDSSYDGIYTEADTFDSIKAFFSLDNLGLLTLKKDARRYNPANKIERDGMDENGLKFRFAPDISNAQVAVLAACLYAVRQRFVAQAVSFAEDMRIITI